MAMKADAAPQTAETASRPGMVISALGVKWVPGTNNPWRWFFSAIWLVYLVAPISSLFSRVEVRSHGHLLRSYYHGPLWIGGGLVIAAAFCVVYIALLIRWGERRAWGRGGLAAIVALSAVACAIYGMQWLPLWIYVSAATGVILTGEPD
jgi:hypothetical protein